MRLPQKQIASELGINTPMYCRIEKGERNVRYDYLEPLSSLLNVSIDELRSLWLADKILTLNCDISDLILSKATALIKMSRNENK